MALLPALMILVSCSDGFADCALADKTAAFPTMEACEAQLGKTLAASAQKKEYLLARCVAAPAAEGNADAAGNAGQAELSWQVSRQGDLLAQVVNSAEQSEAAGQSPLYADNIGSRGGAAVDQNAIALAMAENLGAESAGQEGSAAGSAARPRRSSMLALLGKYSGKKAPYKGKKAAQSAPPRAEADADSLGGYSGKYIYEKDDFDGYSVMNAAMDIVWGNQLPIAEAAFEIEPVKERFYALNPQIAAVLRAPASEPMLPARDYFANPLAPQKLFHSDVFEDKNAAPEAQDSGGEKPQVTVSFMA